MATTQNLILINAATKKELILIKAAGMYRINGEAVIGDLYRDPLDHKTAIVVVNRRVHIDDLDTVLKTIESKEELKSKEEKSS